MSDEDTPREPWPHWAEIRRRWRAALCDPSCPPDDSGRWTWCGAEIGWIRREEGRGR